jgi:hypothetical protein
MESELVLTHFAELEQDIFYDLKWRLIWYQTFCRTLSRYILLPQVKTKLLSMNFAKFQQEKFYDLKLIQN